ncbi:MAG: methyltransferase domain-containing protein [Dehalococcoidia bacterium]
MIDYDKIASDYARHRQVHPKVLEGLIMTSGIEAASKALEVGCGTGNYIVAMQGLVGCSCWGIDPAEQMLSMAEEGLLKVSFQCGKAERIDFPRNFFDLVFSVDVIHHVGHRLDYFQEAYRVLKTGGKVCTVTDSAWIIRHRQPLAAYFPETVEVDLGRYTPIAELRQIMEQVGFGEITENTVEYCYQQTDIQPYRDKAFSCLRLISEEAFQSGIERMERDLRTGPIQCVPRYLLLWGMK